MWSTDSIWFDLSVFTTLLLFGNILMAHFEERTSRYRRALKTLVLVLVFTAISVVFGKVVAFVVLGLTLIPIFVVHGILLPRKGINGWTGEPKEKYYEFRKWDKNIFAQAKPDSPPHQE